MALDPITTLSSINVELEAGWTLFDDAYATFGSEQWTKKFGKTWTYAEQPYHLAYFDRMIATALEQGSSTIAGRLHLRTMGGLNDWNRHEFARRRPGHTVQDLLAEMRKSRDAIRQILARMTDADLAITMKPETFHKMVAKMTPPPLLLLTGQMRVKGLGKMGTFAKLFPEPKPDQVIEPEGGGAAFG